MFSTKNDLDFYTAKLDFEALSTTAEVAMGELLENISKRVYNIRNKINTALEGEWLLRDAKFLAIVAETYHTLNEARSRQNVEVVNRKINGENNNA